MSVLRSKACYVLEWNSTAGRLFMGVPKPTRMTIRDLLQEELRKRSVTVVPESSVSTPIGVVQRL